MKKEEFKKIITETIKEMARIASLFNLSSLDDAEIAAKMPEQLKKNAIAKNIVDFYKENGNKPSKREEIVQKYGWPQTATMGSIFKRMQETGLVVNAGLSQPKQVRPDVNRRVDNFETKNDKEKLALVIYRLKNSTKAEDNKIHSTWFVTNYGQEAWQKLKSLIIAYKATYTSEEGDKIKQEINRLLSSLGFEVRVKGTQPDEFDGPVTEYEDELGGGTY